MRAPSGACGTVKVGRRTRLVAIQVSRTSDAGGVQASRIARGRHRQGSRPTLVGAVALRVGALGVSPEA